MKRKGIGLQVPVGTTDILPRDQAFIRGVEREILDLFSSWAYEEVSTPVCEYLAAINPRVDEEDNLYKLLDREGRILALRPELTTPIARMAATRLRGSELPLRVCYSALVFRYNKPPAMREFRQAGVELIGAARPLADAEIIALAVDTLKGLNINDFQINLGHIETFRGLIRDLDLGPDAAYTIEKCLGRKDFVALEVFLKELGLAREQIDTVLRIPSLHGGEEVIQKAYELVKSEASASALDNLREVYGALKLFGVQDKVAIDLGVLRGFDYYTGIVFEGYTPGLGFPLCEGGRYDGLLGKFGFDVPSTGFAINLERLVSILPVPPQRGAQTLVAGTDMASVVERAKKLRETGVRTEMCLQPITREEAERIAAAKGIEHIEFI